MCSIEAHTRDQSPLDSASMGRREILALVVDERRHADRRSFRFLAGHSDAARHEPLRAQPAHGWSHRFGAGSRRRFRRGSWRPIGRSLRPQARFLDRRSDHRGRRIRQRRGRCTAAGVLGQVLVGIGIGIDFPVSASYASETMPKYASSRMVVATIALQSVGMLLGGAIDLAILRIWSSPEDWRLMIGAARRRLCFFCCAFGFRKVRGSVTTSMAERAHEAQAPAHRGLDTLCCSRGVIARARCWFRCHGFSWM